MNQMMDGRQPASFKAFLCLPAPPGALTDNTTHIQSVLHSSPDANAGEKSHTATAAARALEPR